MSYALRRALQRATALVAPSIALMMLVDPVRADGGAGGAGDSTGGAGGRDSPPAGGADLNGGVSTISGGGGGGGAGAVGGSGGSSLGAGLGGGGGGAAIAGVGQAGSNGGDFTTNVNGGGGGGGGGGSHGFVGASLPAFATTGGNGGRGGLVVFAVGDAGGGGAGGYGAAIDAMAGANLGALTSAAAGGDGGAGGDSPVLTGNGGSGGVGLYILGNAVPSTLSIEAIVKGGAAGAGGNGYVVGQGGTGGAGLIVAGAMLLSVKQALRGGAGGDGGDNTTSFGLPKEIGGAGGPGGIGLSLLSSATVHIDTAAQGGNGAIRGGDGGAGGTGHLGTGAGGAGGAGISAQNTTIILDYADAIGGNGGAGVGEGGSGGAGITGSGLTIIFYDGVVIGGFSGDGTRQADAISLFGSNNRVEIRDYAEIQGEVTAYGGGTNNVFAVNMPYDVPIAFVPTALKGFDTFEKNGSGTVTWVLVPDTRSWDVNVLDGTFAGGVLNAFSPNSKFTVAGPGHLDLGGFDQAIGSLAGAGTVELGAKALTAGSDGRSTEFSGQVTGTGALIKTGAGTFTLSGAGIHTGTTTIEAGKLVADGSLLSVSTVVKDTATLGGSGTLQAVTVEAGGTLAPGHSPGVIHTGNLVLNAGAFLQEEIGGTTSGSFDQTVVTGTVSLGGATLQLAQWSGFASSLGRSFIIIDNDGNDTVTGTFAGLTEGATTSFAGRDLTISYRGGTGNDVVLTDVIPVQPPEPPAITVAQVKAAHLGVLGLTLTDAAAAGIVDDIRGGSYSFDGYITTLIDQADMSTLPAVIVNALLTGVTPTQGHLPELGAFATSQFAAYRDAGSTNPGLGPYEALGLGFSATAGFQSGYGGLTDAQFLASAYQDVFGRAGSTAQFGHFEAQLSYFEGLYAGAGQSDPLADLHAKGAVIGQMIGHAVLDEPELHSFDDTAIAFLRAAAIGQAHYGEPLAMI